MYRMAFFATYCLNMQMYYFVEKKMNCLLEFCIKCAVQFAKKGKYYYLYNDVVVVVDFVSSFDIL